MNPHNTALSPDNDTMDDTALAVSLLADGLRPALPAARREQDLHARLQRRIAASAANQRGSHTVRQGDQVWQSLGKGARACVLHDDGLLRTALVEFAPGTSLPSHRHFADEECVVLRGSLSTGDLVVGPQDYHLAPSGSKHPSIGSAEGALIFLRGTSIGHGTRMLRELVSAWLPGRGASPITVRSSEGDWRTIADGAHIKPLWINGESASLLLRLEPGARLPREAHVQDEECFALEGEAFLGDILLRSGEYQMAPRGSQQGELTSDVGSLLFLHTSAGFARQDARLSS
ncbi:cupin domain-containing protein [Uliginosibacterium sp. H3]|uniref:Cupin domain-containing protein n=1 Tax=Uliginosibacterium silvisoli TaxID=3114758 RepID=A0ABU6K794_9RHOO|nr:cupin domain-containing protein [Uliginosibacterium sp. H3]